MPLYRAEVLVLRARDYRDADKIVTLLTRQEGKVSAVARGARRPKSRLAAAMQPFTYLDCQLWRGRSSLDTVSQCEVLDGFRAIREDLDRTAAAGYVADLADELSRERDADPVFFDLALAGFRLVATAPDLDLLLRVVEVRFLDRAGFRPGLEACASCGGPVPAAGVRYSADLGGVLCGRCPAGRSALAVSRGAVESLRRLLEADFRRALALRVDKSVRAELAAMLRVTLDERLGRPLRSRRFLDAVRDLGPP